MKTLNLLETRAIDFENGEIVLNFPFFAFMMGAMVLYMPTFAVLSQIMGPASILVAFPLSGVGSYFTIRKFFGFEISEINQKRSQPHKIIDGFIKWEEGDKIELGHERKTVRYVGVEDNYNIIFAERESINGKYKHLFSVPPLYVARYLDENESLRRRFEKRKDQKLRNSESEYEKYLETVKKSLNEIEDDAKRKLPR